MSNQELIELGQKYLLNTYGRLPVAMVKGQGTHLYDADGNDYLDFVGGLAVNSLGHCHPDIVKAIEEQANRLLHCSNLYWIEPQIKLAKLLVDNSCLAQVFFGNSGSEANEGAIKLARKYASLKYGQERHEIITMKQSFHGRTLAALAATGQEKFHQDFQPLPQGFTYVPFGNLEALKEALGPKTCAVMVEPIQGEGGVNVPTMDFMQEVWKLCQEKDVLLILDEVQVGMGRTGTLFAYEQFGVEPDILTLAKALGGGVAIGAFLAKEQVTAAFKPGDHGSTFGGNPLATAAGLAAVNAILQDGFLEQVKEKGLYLQNQLEKLQTKYSFIKEVRGLGLIWGMELDRPGADVVSKCMEDGLLINCTNSTVLRLLPPLIVTKEEIDVAVAIMDKALSSV
ncbi:MAG: acetylornithine transaminase [Zhaonellaceae bacterium]|nr:acetylornithine transaminase [Clostridia bacterium]